MSGNEFRTAKLVELQTILNDWAALDASDSSPETKIRFHNLCRRRAGDLIALLISPALAEICT
jgi:hypothetical protein